VLIDSTIKNEIQDDEELLTQFYPSYIANTNIIIENDNTTVMRMIKKNNSLLSLIHTFDMEVEYSTI
jgi:hypothetical protein